MYFQRSLKKATCLLLLATNVNAYECKLEVVEEVPIVSYEYKIPQGKTANEFYEQIKKTGVPKEFLIKETIHSPHLFDRDFSKYESTGFSASGNTKGWTSFKLLVNVKTFQFQLEDCQIEESTEYCNANMIDKNNNSIKMYTKLLPTKYTDIGFFKSNLMANLSFIRLGDLPLQMKAYISRTQVKIDPSHKFKKGPLDSRSATSNSYVDVNSAMPFKSEVKLASTLASGKQNLLNVSLKIQCNNQ